MTGGVKLSVAREGKEGNGLGGVPCWPWAPSRAGPNWFPAALLPFSNFFSFFISVFLAIFAKQTPN
jgi:hypothetical protein